MTCWLLLPQHWEIDPKGVTRARQVTFGLLRIRLELQVYVMRL